MPNRSFSRYVEQELGKFPHFVLFAVLEWVIIILLFLDGFIAFLANEFAKFFELRVPCLFCTRIDHLFVHNYYNNNSICESHKKHISSLAYCHNHKKLADIRKMCELCLLSFATEKESDCNAYKSLVGILHKDDNHNILNLPHGGDFCCSCCGDPLKGKPSNSKAKNGTTFLHAPVPAPTPRGSHASSRNDEKTGMDLSPSRYNELKFLSDSESEFFEDDEGLRGRNLDAHQVSGFDLSAVKEDVKPVKTPSLPETEDAYESSKTPVGKGNKFFGIPLTDSANTSPRWAIRISKKPPLESAETFEADMLGPGDHDSILNCLKGQVRIDRKSLMELYMELDEERSAAAVAANNAMAMITRLQAQKAAVQMEALQYQRMMEEQEEYDQEALQASNDLLAQREEEIMVLEAELEAYREKYGYLEEDCLKMSEDEISDEDFQEIKSQSCMSSYEKSECSTPFGITGRENNKESSNNLDATIIPSVDATIITSVDVTIIPSVDATIIPSMDVTIIPSVSKVADENSKEERTNNNDGVVLPFFQGKAEEEDKKESQTNIREKSNLLGRLKKARHITAFDGVCSLQSSSGSVNQIDEDTGKERTSNPTRQLSHLNNMMKELKADDDSSKQEGKINLASSSNKLRKLHNLVHQNIYFLSRMYIALYDMLNIRYKALHEAMQLLISSIAVQSLKDIQLSATGVDAEVLYFFFLFLFCSPMMTHQTQKCGNCVKESAFGFTYQK